MNKASLRGPSALIKWGYLDAALLGPWSLEFDSTGGTLKATAQSTDTFRVSQLPLTFVVPREIPWVWPVESLQIDGFSVTARVGPIKE